VFGVIRTRRARTAVAVGVALALSALSAGCDARPGEALRMGDEVISEAQLTTATGQLNAIFADLEGAATIAEPEVAEWLADGYAYSGAMAPLLKGTVPDAADFTVDDAWTVIVGTDASARPKNAGSLPIGATARAALRGWKVSNLAMDQAFLQEAMANLTQEQITERFTEMNESLFDSAARVSLNPRLGTWGADRDGANFASVTPSTYPWALSDPDAAPEGEPLAP
jgi:hypothetical protein